MTVRKVEDLLIGPKWAQVSAVTEMVSTLISLILWDDLVGSCRRFSELWSCLLIQS